MDYSLYQSAVGYSLFYWMSRILLSCAEFYVRLQRFGSLVAEPLSYERHFIVERDAELILHPALGLRL